MNSDDLKALVAFIGVNDGANKGFWRIQPRDRRGRWIIMGAAVKSMFRNLKGDLKSIAGRYVGPTGRPGEARVLVRDESGVEDGVYTVQSHNLDTFKAKLPEEFLEERGLDLEYEDDFGNQRSISDADLPSLEEFKATRQDITENDERLARGELTEEEQEAEQAGREESPLAELPGGFESLNQDEAREMLRESGIDPDEFDPEKTDVTDLIDDPNKLDEAGSKALFDAQNTRQLIDGGPSPTEQAMENQRDRNRRKVEAALGRKLTSQEAEDLGFTKKEISSLMFDQAEADRIEAAKASIKEELNEKSVEESGEINLDKDPVDAYVEEAILYGGPTKDVDDFLQEPEETTAIKFPPELEENDILKLPSGEEAVVKSVTPGPDKDGLKTFDVDITDSNGQERRFNVRQSQEMDVIQGRKGEPEPPTPEPTPEPTPDPEPTPTPKPPRRKSRRTREPYPERATQETFLARAREEGREDDGGEINPSTKTREELNKTKVKPLIDPETGKALRIQVGEDKKGRPKYKTITNPDAIIQQLLEDYPEAKINDRGEIIVERKKFTDNDGTEYDYEIAVAKTYGNGFLERYTFTNSETGEKQEFYHYDYKDSYASLHGKTNGIVVFRDQLLGRAIPGSMTTQTARYFGDDKTLQDRIKFFRGRANNADLNNPNMKLLTQEELITKYLEGRAQKLNISTNPETGLPLLTQLQDEIPSFWDAVNADDSDAFTQRLISVLGRLPDNQAARAEMIKILRSQTSDRYNGTGEGQRRATLANNLERAIKNGRFDINNLGRIPYSAKDGNTRITPGMRVRYTNNEGDESVGIVSALNPNSGPNDYHDTVRVRFEDGTEVNILATKYMEPTDDDTPLTNYTGRVEGEDLVERRAERYNIDLAVYKDIFDPDEGEDGPSENPGPDGSEPDDLPPLGGRGGSETSPETTTRSGVQSGAVSVSNSSLANKFVGKSPGQSEEYISIVSSGVTETENFIKTESGSRSEKAALKPTPQARDLKNELTEEGSQVAQRVFSNEEYVQKISQHNNIAGREVEAKKEFDELQFEAIKDRGVALDAYSDKKAEVLNSIEDVAEARKLNREFESGNFEGYSELGEVYANFKEATKKYADTVNAERETLRELREEKNASLRELQTLRKNLIKEELQNSGVEFGGFTAKQLVDDGKLVFTGPRKAKNRDAANERAVQRKYEEQFNEILSFIPKNVIESVFSRDIPLRVGVGNTRGHYSPGGHYTVLNTKSLNGESPSIFDVGIHELWHAAQTNNADISALEHAWAFDRAIGDDTEFPRASSTSLYGSNERFINFKNETPESYTQKTYSDFVLFSDINSEVSTTLMQGVFSNPKYIGLDYETGKYDEDVVGFALGLMLGSGR